MMQCVCVGGGTACSRDQKSKSQTCLAFTGPVMLMRSLKPSESFSKMNDQKVEHG